MMRPKKSEALSLVLIALLVVTGACTKAAPVSSEAPKVAAPAPADEAATETQIAEAPASESTESAELTAEAPASADLVNAELMAQVSALSDEELSALVQEFVSGARTLTEDQRMVLMSAIDDQDMQLAIQEGNRQRLLADMASAKKTGDGYAIKGLSAYFMTFLFGITATLTKSDIDAKLANTISSAYIKAVTPYIEDQILAKFSSRADIATKRLQAYYANNAKQLFRQTARLQDRLAVKMIEDLEATKAKAFPLYRQNIKSIVKGGTFVLAGSGVALGFYAFYDQIARIDMSVKEYSDLLQQCEVVGAEIKATETRLNMLRQIAMAGAVPEEVELDQQVELEQAVVSEEAVTTDVETVVSPEMPVEGVTVE